MSSLIKIRYTLPGPGEVPQWIDKELLDYDGPSDLAPPPIGGARAVDSRIVAHTSDRLPTEYVYTVTGNLHATTPEGLDTRYFRLKGLLQYADQVWRGSRYLNLDFALISAGTPLRGQCVKPAPIACAVKELRWYDSNGRPLE